MTKEVKTQKTTKLTAKGKKPFEIANESALKVMQLILDLLKETLKAGKLNPAQGLLGMSMIANILNGGEYTVGIEQRPFSMKNPETSPFYAEGLLIPAKPIYPFEGAATTLNPIEALFRFFDAAQTTTAAQLMVAEVYANANVPRMFPKLLGDQAYADIRLLIAYLAQTDIVKSKALGVKTFVEGETKIIETIQKPLVEAEKQAGKIIKASIGKLTDAEPEE